MWMFTKIYKRNFYLKLYAFGQFTENDIQNFKIIDRWRTKEYFHNYIKHFIIYIIQLILIAKLILYYSEPKIILYFWKQNGKSASFTKKGGGQMVYDLNSDLKGT